MAVSRGICAKNRGISSSSKARCVPSDTRLMRIPAGTFTTKPFIHEYWEEVYVISGDLIVGNDEQGRNGESFLANTYACRPPGAWHGPFKSETGCVLLEIHYYDPA